MSDPLTIAAFLDDSTGYGTVANSIVRWLVQHKIPVRLTPLQGTKPPADLIPYTQPYPGRVDVLFACLSNIPSQIEARLLYTTSEQTEIPREFGMDLGRFEGVIVPSKFSSDAIAPWIKNIHLCPQGVDMVWSPIVFSPFVFTAVAADSNCPERKRIQELADVFSQTFTRESDVRLQLKRSPECEKIHTFDTRVELVTQRLSRPTYNEVIAKTTVGVQPSAMEGWSLPVNEFMAAGRPVIAPRAGAIGDYLPAEACFELPCQPCPAPKKVFLGKGVVPYVDMAALGGQMRFAYENKLEVARRGMAAYEAAQNYTTHTMGQRFLEICQTLIS